MSWTPVSGLPLQYSNSDNGLANDYWLKFYDAGTTNPYSMATDSSGGTRLAKCKINNEGYPITNSLDDTTVFVPYVDQNYRAVLYRSESDADADNTANAAFNIDDLLPDATVAADVSQITTRGTTLQAQDDYDRSPLFTDGDGFTAGLGPHIITPPVQVPAWTPNSSNFRIYKLASSGAITTPTVTAQDATTFTISDTLLSTDTIFIGDDEFRNQMDGDPDDIKERLSLSDALLASNNLSDVNNASTARTNLDVYSKSETFSTLTTVWSGSSTSVDLTGISGGYPGDGLYLIYTDTSIYSSPALVYFRQGYAGGEESSHMVVATNSIITTSLYKTSADIVGGTRYTYDATTGNITSTNLTIKMIKKIGES